MNPWTAAWRYPVLFVLSYLLGSISFAYLSVALIRREDLRQSGTGNLGATNAARRLGWAGFVLVFLGDAGKAYLAERLALRWPGGDLATLTAAAGVLVGHSYSPFLGFSGGKGLACAVGTLFALSPVVLLVMLLLAAVFLLATRDLHLAPALAALFFPPVAWLFWRSPLWTGLSLPLVALILWRHRHNLAAWFTRRAK